eukprot:4897315-Prymnesium_polylepis.1
MGGAAGDAAGDPADGAAGWDALVASLDGVGSAGAGGGAGAACGGAAAVVPCGDRAASAATDSATGKSTAAPLAWAAERQKLWTPELRAAHAAIEEASYHAPTPFQFRDLEEGPVHPTPVHVSREQRQH